MNIFTNVISSAILLIVAIDAFSIEKSQQIKIDKTKVAAQLYTQIINEDENTSTKNRLSFLSNSYIEDAYVPVYDLHCKLVGNAFRTFCKETNSYGTTVVSALNTIFPIIYRTNAYYFEDLKPELDIIVYNYSGYDVSNWDVIYVLLSDIDYLIVYFGPEEQISAVHLGSNSIFTKEQYLDLQKTPISYSEISRPGAEYVWNKIDNYIDKHNTIYAESPPESYEVPGMQGLGFTWYRGCSITTFTMIVQYWKNHKYSLPGDPTFFTWNGPKNRFLWVINLCQNYNVTINRPMADMIGNAFGVPVSCGLFKGGGESGDYGTTGIDQLITLQNLFTGVFKISLDNSPTWDELKSEIHSNRPLKMGWVLTNNGSIVGGHATCVYGYNETTIGRTIRVFNTWQSGFDDFSYDNGNVGNVGGISGPNSLRDFVYIRPTPPPSPTNLTLSLISPNQIDLTWQDNSKNESGFIINRKKEGGVWSQITVVGVNITTYQDKGCLFAILYG